MATSATAVRWETKSVEACGGTVRFEQAGTGPSLLVLPRDNGHPPANQFLDGLAGEFTVSHAWLPGFHGGDPEAWEWLGNVRDLAMVMRRALGEIGAGPTAILGFGFGGWLAAEMLAMGHAQFSNVVLVNPMGIQPKSEYILDQFLISTEAYARAGFASDESFDAAYGAEPEFEQLEGWETDREMASRLAWKPYMYDASLAGLLAGVPTPALIVRGDSDHVVPAECAELYRAALPNARLEVVAGGHAVDLEQPEKLGTLIKQFLLP